MPLPESMTTAAEKREIRSPHGLGALKTRPALRSVRQYPPRSLSSHRLSRRERLILTELARGLSTEEIALDLVLSPHTVRTHVKNALRRLEARSRAQAVAIAISEGLITP